VFVTTKNLSFAIKIVVIYFQISSSDGGFRVSIIIENLRIQLNLSKLNPTPYNLCMIDQTIAKPLGLIRDLKI
jgi:hypothetical protein